MPGISFIPYFPDEQVNITVGDYRLWNWHHHCDKIAVAGNVREFLKRYFELFHRGNGKPETRIAVLSPLNGNPFPNHQDLEHLSRITNCLMAAYLFNLPLTDTGWGFCSSDNFIGMYQRFEPSSDVPSVSFTFGSYFKMTVGGSWEYLHFTTPQFVPDVFGCSPIDSMLACLVQLCSGSIEPLIRLFRALEWLKVAFMNYEGFQLEARAVAMCTAFETLLDFPEQGKASYFSRKVNELLPSNRMAKTSRQLGKKMVDDTPVGWWCREFYDLRSRIVHGEQIPATAWRNALGADQFLLSLRIFEECVWGLLVEWGRLPQHERLTEFMWRSHWRDALGVNINDFMPVVNP